jgi:hypothetical protein
MVTLKIRPNGQVEAIRSAEAEALTAGLGPGRLERVSRVEPVEVVRRLLFLAIRRLVSNQSRLAAWTRTWRGPWRARLLVGSRPILGPYEERAEAIRAEVRWLEAQD